MVKLSFMHICCMLCVPKIWLLGLTSIWAHNLFVFVGFGFPTIGGLILGDPNTLKVDAPSGKVEVALKLIPTFRSPLSSDAFKGTTGQPSAGCQQAMTLSTRLEMIAVGGGGGCLRYSS